MTILKGKGLIYLTLFLLTFTSCGPDMPENAVRYGYMEFYLLEEGEKEVPTDTIMQQQYEPLAYFGKHPIPLNRVIQSDDYTVFIGVAIKGSAEEIAQAALQQDSITVIESDNQNNLFRQDSLYVYRHIYQEQTGKVPVVLNFTSSDSVLVKNVFDDRDAWLKRKLQKSTKE